MSVQISVSRQLCAFAVAFSAACFPAVGMARAQSPDWTFWYIGAHLGHDWNDVDVQGFAGLDDNGIAGGLLGGANLYQSGTFVAGFEADITWLDVEGQARQSFPLINLCDEDNGGQIGNLTSQVQAKVNWKATLRGRAGFLAAPTMFVYGTAGIAWADVELKARRSTPAWPNSECGFPGVLTVSGSSDEIFFGGVVGGGTEMQLAPNMYGRFEVLHYFFDDETLNVAGNSLRVDLDETIARAGLTFRLD